MAAYFLDSSALVKRYLSELGSSWVIDVTNAGSGHRIYVSRIAGIEVVSAMARKARAGTVAREALGAALAAFDADFVGVYRTVPLSRVVIGRSMELARLYGLRAYDAVQLAAALHANTQRIARRSLPLVFVSADHELNDAARTEGFQVEDPNHYA
jgi:predicted nucleic acid-binding protein